MKDHPLQPVRAQVRSTADAVRWACILEATAPKAGNVFPGRSHRDLCYFHFVTAAEIAAVELTRIDVSFGTRVNEAVKRSREATGTNVNLGIVLICAPLVTASMQATIEDDPVARMMRVLQSLSPLDGREVFAAIRNSGAGGLSTTESLDIHETMGDVDLLAAMRLASDRDDVALQYSSGYRDLFERVLPIVDLSIRQVGDLLGGIAEAHLRLLAQRPDTLIVRKMGAVFAEHVREQAAVAVNQSFRDREAFDAFLRAHGANPGTTADLIAASLLVLLSEFGFTR
jgi:triphosphoribosyl-dephospho-CoA synthase